MKYYQFFKDRLPELADPNPKGESVNSCIFHEHGPGNPTLAVNVETGRWKCYVPYCVASKGGSYKTFDKLLKGEIGTTQIVVEPIAPSIIESFHHILWSTTHALDILHQKRGYTDETIRRFNLGWDGNRILIPIKGPDGNYVNVRKYAFGAAQDKMVAWGAGYNRARLFPTENLVHQTVYLFEGETDTMLACQLGLPALTCTGGADTWLPEFNEALRDKDVVLCYDKDEAGRKGAARIAQQLLKKCQSVKKVDLPLAGTKEEKDFTDYVVKLKHTVDEFLKLVQDAPLIEPVVAEANQKPPDEVEAIHFSGIGQNRLMGRRVSSTILVSGKDLAPFAVPRKITFACDQMGSEKMCDRCGICQAEGMKEVVVPEWSSDFLQMTNVPIEKLEAHKAKLAGVPYGCHKFTSETKEHANIEIIKGIPEIDFSADNAPYAIRMLYYLGHGLESNKTYVVKAVVMPDPKTQSATALIYEATPSQTTIEKFEITPEILAMLKIFQVPT